MTNFSSVRKSLLFFHTVLFVENWKKLLSPKKKKYFVKLTLQQLSDTFTKFFPKLRERKFPYFPHITQNFSASSFSQKFRQINVLLKKFIKIDLTEKNLLGSEFLVFPHCATVWSLQNFCIKVFWKISVKTTSLVKTRVLQ